MNLKIGLLLFCFTSMNLPYLLAAEKEQNISYSNGLNGARNLLDVYYPKNTQPLKNVVVFIHGGSWESGKKNTYWWLGRNLANKDVVTVIINYSLAPQYQYEQMATDCASAVKWVKNNIEQFGGNPGRIFVMGHSAGGHLAALINTDPRYFKQQGISNPIKGVILNDCFGLDMDEYLSSAVNNDQTASFLHTFSKDKQNWKLASPLTYSKNIQNPYLIFVGGKTYPSIQTQSKRLYEQLINHKQPVEYYVIKKKKHIGMISQMIFKSNELYNCILNFIKA